MKAVFLAAGRGTRLRPLTYKNPKPMLRAAGKNLLEHNLDKLPQEIDELILVVNYLADKIINYFGNSYKGRPIKYIRQKELLGTGHAVHICRDFLSGKFLVMMGDDIYNSDDIVQAIEHDYCMLVKETSDKYIGGRVILSGDGHLEKIKEGEHNGQSSLVNTGLYVLNDKFFDYDLVKINGRDEYGLPQTLVSLAQDIPVKIQKATLWHQINDLNGLEAAREYLEK